MVLEPQRIPKELLIFSLYLNLEEIHCNSSKAIPQKQDG